MSWRGSFMAIFEQIDHLPIWIIIRFKRNIRHYVKKVIDDLIKQGQEINILLVKHNFLTVTIKVSCYTSIIGKVLFNRSETLDYTYLTSAQSKMADGVWKPSDQLSLNKFFDLIIPSMKPSKIQNGGRGPQNGRQGLKRGLPIEFWALPSTFTK